MFGAPFVPRLGIERIGKPPDARVECVARLAWNGVVRLLRRLVQQRRQVRPAAALRGRHGLERNIECRIRSRRLTVRVEHVSAERGAPPSRRAAFGDGALSGVPVVLIDGKANALSGKPRVARQLARGALQIGDQLTACELGTGFERGNDSFIDPETLVSGSRKCVAPLGDSARNERRRSGITVDMTGKPSRPSG